MTTTTNNRRKDSRRLARATTFCALALASVLCLSREAAAQWTTSGANISNTNTGNVGINTPSPGSRLDVGGKLRMFDYAPPGAGTSTDAGYLFGSAIPSGLITEVGGELVNFGINTPQFGTWTATRSGGLIRVDTRASERRFAFYAYPAGATTNPAVNRFSVHLDTGDVFMAASGGNVGIGTAAPTYLLDVSGSAGSPFRVRDSAGREYFSTRVHTGIYGTAPVVSIAGSRLMIDTDGPDGDNNTIIRRVVNSMIFNPSDHPTLPGAFMVRQVGGYAGLFVEQRTSGNVGVGTTAPAAKLHVAGDVRVDGNITAKYQDVAEWVPSTQKLSAGTVVVLDTGRDNHVASSSSSYDTRVAGVISARPGLSLGEAGEGKVLVATTGRVKVRVDATRGRINVGDLLVTSDRPGYAMKSEPVRLGRRKIHSPGTIIGKALESIAGGTGEILVLLSLQ